MFKLFEINSIRSRMVTGFLFLTFLLLILALVSLYIVERTSQVARIHSDINQLEILTLNLIKTDNDFFDLEVINEDYFKTRNSFFLKRRDSLNRRIQHKLGIVLNQTKDREHSVDSSLKSIATMLSSYNTKFKSLEELVFRKGFKDYGTEGAMRFHAHILEEESPGNFTSDILYLRRHEKDFLLRNDPTYVSAFKGRSGKLLETLQLQSNIHKDMIHHLNEYTRLFIELADIQTQLGLNSEAGLRSELNRITFYISDQYYLLTEYSYTQATHAQSNARIFYIVMLCGAVFFSLLSGYWISKKLSEPIARLSRLVNDSISTKTTAKTDFSLRNAANEINTLASSFIQLMTQAKSQLSEIKSKSKQLKEKNRQLKKLNRELDNFLYSTAHDLRAPLSSMLGLVNIIRYDNKQQELNAYLDMMENSIYRSENFIAQIVNYSKNKRVEIVSEKIDLKSVVQEVLNDHHFISGYDQIKIQMDIQEHVPFYSDKNRLTIILNNLVSNAVKYRDPEKKSFIQISAHVHPHEVVLEFADNGVGIAEEHLGKIFDMFYRANYNSKGSGLGLFIFRETIRRLKGYVQVQSREGVGTKFIVQLPNLYNEKTVHKKLTVAA